MLTPFSPELLARCDVTVQETEEYFDVSSRTTVARFVDRVLRSAVLLADGSAVLPRHALSSPELESMGYRVIEVRASPPRNMEWLDAGRHLDLRHKQTEAFRRMQGQDGFLVLGTGRGKTVLALKSTAGTGKATLVFVDNGGLLEQWVERATHPLLLGLPADALGRCTGPVEKWEWVGRGLCITTFQSFAPAVAEGRVPVEFLEHFGNVVIDEAHVSLSPTRRPLLSLFRGARLALTATPERRGWEHLAYLHFGGPLYEDREPDLLPSVYVRALPVSKPRNYPLRGIDSYGKMLNDVLGTKWKGGDVSYLQHCIAQVQKLRERGRKTMILSPRKGILYDLADAVGGMPVIDGSVAFADRPWMLNASDCIAVTTAIGEKALDRVDLDALVMVVPVGQTAVGRLRQGAGRILRGLADKPEPELYINYPQSQYGAHIASANAEMCDVLGFSVKERPSMDAAKETSARELHARANTAGRTHHVRNHARRQ